MKKIFLTALAAAVVLLAIVLTGCSNTNLENRIKALEVTMNKISPDGCSLNPPEKCKGDGFLTLDSAKQWTATIRVNSEKNTLDFIKTDGDTNWVIMSLPYETKEKM